MRNAPQPCHTALISVFAHLPAALQSALGQGSGLPQRCFLPRPPETGAFILPLRQSFIKNARLMPGTRVMLALLAGWAGQGRSIELTEGTIAKHIGRSVRQVYRYIQDASREGYLRYSYTKNRSGLITGIKVWLRFELLRHLTAPKHTKTVKNAANPARTHTADINQKQIYNTQKSQELDRKLERLRSLIDH